ncbi:hypothetical protein [Actinomadura montaniterrae]|uniref:Uncharacterized protein n=1 Tax=Actinomadura montaniterrae TaxID=1803903 RepID=A0A6L3W0H9_9ACTN|nr:hypothetical protein [Actinomadura montaniterrae]KAB2384749.1 hypothetical protein F9B16_09890 [Actinomadura montaniterrae]
MAEWKHGWIPLTPGAMASKQHRGKGGGKGSAKPKVSAKPAAKKTGGKSKKSSLAAVPLHELDLSTSAGRAEVMRRQRLLEDKRSVIPRAQAGAAGFRGGKPHRKSALKRKGR